MLDCGMHIIAFPACLAQSKGQLASVVLSPPAILFRLQQEGSASCSLFCLFLCGGRKALPFVTARLWRPKHGF